MAIQLKNGKYGCMFCDKEFGDLAQANAHRENDHDYVLVPMLKEEIANLLHYLFSSSGSKELIPPELWKRLNKYLKTKKSSIEIQ